MSVRHGNMYGVLHVGIPVRSYTQSDEQMNNSIQLFIISCGDTRLTSQKMRRDHPQKRLQPADLAVRPMILSSLPPGYQESEAWPHSDLHLSWNPAKPSNDNGVH